MISSPEAFKQYKKDATLPLVDVLDSFKVFVTHKQGNQGILDEASNGTLEVSS